MVITKTGFTNKSLCEKCPNMEFSLVRIFPYSVQMRKKYGQEKTRYMDTFHAVSVFLKDDVC